MVFPSTGLFIKFSPLGAIVWHNAIVRYGILGDFAFLCDKDGKLSCDANDVRLFASAQNG